MTPHVYELRDQIERLEIENKRLKEDITYAIESLKLIEKLQTNGNTVDAQYLINRLKQSL